MAKAATQQKVDQEELLTEPVTEMITYVPNPGDPVQTTWCGHKFEANVPREIKGNAGGTAQERLNAHLIERAKENRLFRVGNAKPKRDPAKEPTTAEEYRLYFVEWLKGFCRPDDHAEDLIARLAKDRELQVKCGVGTDDFEFMGNLFNPRIHELAKQDELNRDQLAALWMRFGFNQLPW